MSSGTSSSNTASGSKVYYRFAKHYDRFFSPVYVDRIHDAIKRLNIPQGSRVLEIGVGTGISLAAYPRGVNVVGIDLSQSMLDQAAARVEADGLQNVELRCMNACELDFPDASFDYVMAFHVVSVVDDIDRLMQGIYRVCKPGGTIVVINHFRSPRWYIAPVVDLISPVTKHLGWRTTLRIDDLSQSAPIKVKSQYKSSPTSLFTVVVAERD